MATTGHRTIELHNEQYLLTPTRVTLRSRVLKQALSEEASSEYIAITAVEWDKSIFTKHDLEDVCQQYADNDDVWCRHFLSLVVLLTPVQKRCSTKSSHIIPINNRNAKLPAGPLIADKSSGKVFLVSRLVEDTTLAFVSSFVPSLSHKAGFVEFDRSDAVKVPVPSRLYYPKDVFKPLNGVRVAVKDTIDLKGLRTSFGSSSWLDMYPAKSTTAPCVQKLIDAGAVILGKVKTTEFAEGVDASEWLDTPCPLNPRGDGRQQTSSSSTGSAAAVAAYQWLDVSLGTDTGGSIRHPAAVNGCFGQRPTHGRTDLTGVLGATNLFNTVGIFARDIQLFKQVGSCLIDAYRSDRPLAEKRKYNLLYPTRAARISANDQHHHGQHRWFPHPEIDQSLWTPAEKQIEQTVVAMEQLLNCKRIPFNINELWEATPVIGQSKNLDEAVGSIYSTITTSSALATGIEDFSARYQEMYDGAEPPMSDVVKARLDHGKTITPEQFAKAIESAEAFKEWTTKVLFGSYDEDATTLLIFPQTCGRPAYRDTIPERGELFNDTFSIYAFGYLVGCPDYTIPVAEVPYLSEVTGQTEYLPTAISLIGKPGADMELFDVMEHLQKNNALSNVEAGSRLFHEIY